MGIRRNRNLTGLSFLDKNHVSSLRSVVLMLSVAVLVWLVDSLLDTLPE